MQWTSHEPEPAAMGVPAFFAWLVRKYPEVLSDLPGTVDENGDPSPAAAEDWGCDNLYLDMNGIIHPCCHPEDGRPAPSSEAEMYENVAVLLDTLMDRIKPERMVYLAIDGVAPRAKMNQQRARRFRSQRDAKEKRAADAKLRAEMAEAGLPVPPPKPPSWDHNVITPGTRFMADLAVFLKAYVAERLSSHPAWKGRLALLSTAAVPGEGEHKLVGLVRRLRSQPGHDPNTRHCIVGDDADLIMLALATHEMHFTIVRTRRWFAGGPPTATAQEENPGDAWQLMHIPVLREYLEQEFAPLMPPPTKPGRRDRKRDGGRSGRCFERLVDGERTCLFHCLSLRPHGRNSFRHIKEDRWSQTLSSSASSSATISSRTCRRSTFETGRWTCFSSSTQSCSASCRRTST